MSVRRALLLGLLGSYGCEDSRRGDAVVRAPTITIAGHAYSPANLAVKPGMLVTVVNRDGEAHSVTTTSAPGTFAPATVNGVFLDTGPFRGTKTLVIPSTAQPNTVVPYFCTEHGSMMGTATITILPP
jgi:plastocyanin